MAWDFVLAEILSIDVKYYCSKLSVVKSGWMCRCNLFERNSKIQDGR